MPIHGYPGNIVTANPTAPTSTTASGVWTLEQQLQAEAAGNWPSPPPGPSQISRSLRFNSADSAYLSWTPASAGNRKTWTWSGWVKRSFPDGIVNTSNRTLFSAGDSAPWFQLDFLFYGGVGNLEVSFAAGAGSGSVSSAIFRDFSAWYHVVCSVDTTQATDSNRVKLYVNGVQQSFSATSYPSQNLDTQVNNTGSHYIGRTWNGNYFDGYMTEVNFIDGSALDPTSFGTTNLTTGVWEPIAYEGSYGTNGFYLPFNQEYETFLSDFLVVAGGGAGGGNNPGCGGGAGGYVSQTSTAVALGVSYTVTVGAGGSGYVYNNTGNDGNNSVAIGYTAKGGGGGSDWGNRGSTEGGRPGGSGGGAGVSGGFSGGASTQFSTYGYGNGNAGGRGTSGSYGTGGGGGAGAVGGDGASAGGNGGNGLQNSITGSAIYYAGGGGGGHYPSGAGTGGLGGGGAGGNNGAGTAGTANTGGGGGGGYPGANGGSGVVIIKIPDTVTATFSGGVTSSLSTAVPGYKIYTVTATSTTSETVTFS